MKGIKRCKSRAPQAGYRCTQNRGHIGLHSSRDVVWGPGRMPRSLAGGFGPSMPTWADLTRPSGATDAVGFWHGSEAEPPLVPLDSEEQLRQWWYEKAAGEIDATVPKAIEYGATDLIDIGVMLARTMRREVSEQEAAELGVFFYLIGKVARWQSAIERGERPSDDTLLDIGVYVRMAQRIRDAGSWPGTEEK